MAVVLQRKIDVRHKILGCGVLGVGEIHLETGSGANPVAAVGRPLAAQRRVGVPEFRIGSEVSRHGVSAAGDFLHADFSIRSS